VSINTLILEELCVNENATVLSDVDPAESTQSDNAECAAIKSTNIKDTEGIFEKVGARDASLAADSIGANAERASLIDNDVEMREAHWEETRKSQEFVKACCCTTENSLKHSIAKNTQEEIEAKRIRLEREDSAESSDKAAGAPQPSTVVEETDLMTSVPKIAKIEAVHYDVASIKSMPKHNVQHSNLIATNMFSPGHYEYCNESNMSSLDQDFMKGRNSRVLETLSRLSRN